MTSIAHNSLLKIPQRQSNYTVMTSSMEIKWDDIPDWISCPPAVIVSSSSVGLIWRFHFLRDRITMMHHSSLGQYFLLFS